MFARRTAEGILQHITGYQAVFSEPTAYVALFTVAPSDDTGSGAIEVSGGGYQRVQTVQGSSGTWSAASTNTDPTTLANASAIAFGTATANWGTIIAFGLYDQLTGGNLLAWDWLGAYSWAPCTISAASPGVFTAPAHGYSVNDSVVFTTVFGGVVPSSSQSSVIGVLSIAHAATDTFDVTNGSVAVNTSSSGNGLVRKILGQSIPAGVQPSFAAGGLVLSAA